MAGDLGEMVVALRAEYGQWKVLLLAHSSGAVMGLNHTAHRRETVAAFVWFAQVTHPVKNETESHAWLLERAESQGETRIVEELRQIGPPPWTASELLTQRNQLRHLNGFYTQPPSALRDIRQSLATPKTGRTNILPMCNAMPWSLGHLSEENQTFDAFAAHPKLTVPAYLKLGRHDHAVCPRAFQGFARCTERTTKGGDRVGSGGSHDPGRGSCSL